LIRTANQQGETREARRDQLKPPRPFEPMCHAVLLCGCRIRRPNLPILSAGSSSNGAEVPKLLGLYSVAKCPWRCPVERLNTRASATLRADSISVTCGDPVPELKEEYDPDVEF
jgi:hypothetical protein